MSRVVRVNVYVRNAAAARVSLRLLSNDAQFVSEQLMLLSMTDRRRSYCSSSGSSKMGMSGCPSIVVKKILSMYDS